MDNLPQFLMSEASVSDIADLFIIQASRGYDLLQIYEARSTKSIVYRSTHEPVCIAVETNSNAILRKVVRKKSCFIFQTFFSLANFGGNKSVRRNNYMRTK